MKHDFWVLLDPGSDRAPHWREVLGDDSLRLPVTTPVPYRAHVETVGATEVYLIALAVLTADQRERLVENLARRNGLPAVEVRALLASEGVPVLARECSVVVYHPQRWLS